MTPASRSITLTRVRRNDVSGYQQIAPFRNVFRTDRSFEAPWFLFF